MFQVSTVYSKIWSTSNDIGMLKLNRRISLNGSTKKAVRLPYSSNYYPADHSSAYVQGWGANPNNPSTDQMYRADVATVSADECTSYWVNPQISQSTQVCAIGNRDAGPCTVSELNQAKLFPAFVFINFL